MTTQTLEKETIRVIVFTLGDYYFALPIHAIIQVTESPPELIQHLDGLGLVMLENQSIILLNLHKKLSPSANAVSKEVRGDFLVLTQTPNGELCGIPLDTLPNMMELSHDQVQPLPTAYRATNLYGLARFVSFVSMEGNEKKRAVYFLDIEQKKHFPQRPIEREYSQTQNKNVVKTNKGSTP